MRQKHVHFCNERSEKEAICRELGVTHFIDDHLEVLLYLKSVPYRFLFAPDSRAHAITRTFRIFVSSTFTDLKEERNALQKYVFPRLRDLCTQHGCRFQAIDLRWGVREEAGLDQQTMKICLDEASRSQRASPRPNFIVLLGDRYGWRPLPAEIPAREFDHIRMRTTAGDDLHLLDTWYRRDDNARYQRDANARPEAVYCLQPRKQQDRFADFQVWEREVERPLRAILLQLDITWFRAKACPRNALSSCLGGVSRMR